MASAQHPSTKPRVHLTLSLERFGRYAPIAGYWLLAAIVVVLRPNAMQLLVLASPLVVLSVVVCASARQRID